MNRIFSIAGGLLVLAGLAILAYVGVSFAQSTQRAAVPRSWSPSERANGQKLQSRLLGHQSVAVPATRRQASIPVGEPAVRMVIPKIAVDAPVVQTAPVGGVWEVADWSVGHLSTTPNPGAVGNAAYAAHDDIKGELFKRIDELKPGDDILLYTRHAVYHYTVVNQETVDPSNVSVLAPTKDSSVTLVSCAPYWVDTERLIVRAVLKSRSSV